jgi:CHAT domain-containing protein/Tfp pilus assembly protein PilF
MDRKKREKIYLNKSQKELIKLNTEAENYFNNGNYEAALELNLKALTVQISLFGEAHTDTAFFYSNAGVMYGLLGDIDKSIEFKNKALDIQLKVFGEEHPDVANSYNNLAISYSLSGNFNDALYNSIKALEINLKVSGEEHPDTASSFISIGSIYASRGEYDKSFYNYFKALNIKIKVFGENDPAVVNVFRNIGAVYSELGNYKESLEYYNKALKIQLKEIMVEHPSTAITYNLISGAYFLLGDLDRAIESTNKALVIQLKVFGEEHPDTANTYCDLGVNYGTAGNYDKALECLFKAMNIQLLIFGQEHNSIIRTYRSIGSIFLVLDNKEKSLEYFYKALNLQLKLFGDSHPYTANIYREIGSIYYSLGKYEKSLEYHQKALEIQLEVLGEEHPEIAKTYHSISSCCHSVGDFKNAMYFIEKSINTMKIFSPYQNLQFMVNLLDTYKESEKRGTLHKKRDFDSISGYVNDAVKIIENVIVEKSPITIQNDKSIINTYHAIIDYLSITSNIQMTFEMAERVKGREFLLRLSIIDAAIASGADQALIVNLISLLDDIALLAEKRDSFEDYTNLKYLYLTEKINEQKNKLRIIENELLKIEIYRELRDPEVISIDAAAVFCKNGKAIIEYVLSNDPEYLLCILIKESGRKIIKFDDNTNYDNLITGLRKTIMPDENYDLPADSITREQFTSSLYEKLIEPFEKELHGISELIIIPDGILGLVPFDLLRKSKDKPYLCENYSISLVPSVSILNYIMKRDHYSAKENFLGIGGVLYTNENEVDYYSKIKINSGVNEYFRELGLTWEDLPGSLNEILEIEKQVFDSVQTRLLTGIDASERNVKQFSMSGVLADYSNIHFACHGYMDSKLPQNSSIVLSEVSGFIDSDEDGYLTMKEIAQLNFNADLVVLSACDTGIGKILPGEGIINLSRAFHIAGCKRVAVTLWQIADDPTSKFMIEMYKRKIKDGESYKEAFRQTKIEFIRSSEFNEPVFWAPFVLYGI